eukprot:8980538-Alexandrium_andersonii.AAC.1
MSARGRSGVDGGGVGQERACVPGSWRLEVACGGLVWQSRVGHGACDIAVLLPSAHHLSPTATVRVAVCTRAARPK